MKFTKGKWRYSKPTEEFGVVWKSNVRIADAAINDLPLDEQRANAHLIAAAPELLEACKAAKKYLEPDLVEPGRTVFWNLVAAIKKAEGES